MSSTDATSMLAEYGILAASAHNTQPWLVSIDDDSIEVCPDPGRRLTADATGRELSLSLGCFWGNVRVGAQALGLKTIESVIDDRVRIVVEATGSSSSEHTLEAIRSRRNNRFPLSGPFDATISGVDLTALQMHVATDLEARAAIAAITREAFKQHLMDRAFCAEFADWVRSNTSSARDGIPGYALGFPTVISYIMPFLIKTFPMAGPISRREGALMESAPATIVICGSADQTGWISAGRAFSEVAVRLQELGYTCAINNSAVEVSSCADELAQLLGTKLCPLMVFRAGRPTKPCRPTPRRPLAEFMVRNSG